MNPSKYKSAIVITGVLPIILTLIGGCQRSQVPPDPLKHELLVRKARSYLQNSWDWFIPPWPPVFGGGNGTLRNQSGAFPWADRNLGQTRDDCNSRIYYATRANQTSWYQYYPPLYPDAGWPDTIGGDPTHKAGFVCYALVAQAMKDAGYDLDPNSVLSSDWFADGRFPTVTGTVRVGDIVVYEFNSPLPDPQWEHSGVITDVSGSDPSNFSVVSSIGVVEHFSYGASEKRVGVFGTSQHGGDFQVWPPWPQPITYRIVRPQ